MEKLIKVAICPNCGFQEQFEAKEGLKNFYLHPIDKIQFRIGRRKLKPIDVHGNIPRCKQCHRIAVVELRIKERGVK